MKLEKLEELAAKKRKSIEERKLRLKKETDTLKDIEAEIEILKGEVFRKEINQLNLSPEEFDNFRKYVLKNKENLLDVIDKLAAEDEKQKEGAGLFE